MAKNKTTETNNSVELYLQNIPDEKKRRDCREMISLIHQETGLEPKMWGTGIVGFGSYHYVYGSGHQGDAPLAGISARANAISIYLDADPVKREDFLRKFGKYKSGKSCIYVKKIEDIDTAILLQMVNHSIEFLKEKY
ncbi:protein of unknown function (DU1801) [Dyadobacter koreensis]|uniref:YdhG-like domain-containing protein n=1 Tax=Dyadobacter koreensis TaxID=408657 RepID=A0A1H6QLY8_9BACT|nr:DUF1801 domain-containing protein [Dyadobacter koreensis]SEI44603.1 protein of unknown function (DU1801) [Dyadobacter koreensis]